MATKAQALDERLEAALQASAAQLAAVIAAAVYELSMEVRSGQQPFRERTRQGRR